LEEEQEKWDKAEEKRALNEKEDIKKACDGLDDCNTDIKKFKTAMQNCPNQVDKIIKLIECYNEHNDDEKIVTSISKDTDLLELLDNLNVEDLEKVNEWLTSLESEQNKSENDDTRHAITSRKSVLDDTTNSETPTPIPWYKLWAGRTRKKMTRKTKHSRKKRRTKYLKKNK